MNKNNNNFSFQNKLILLIMVVLSILFFSKISTPAMAGSLNQGVFSRDSTPYGVPYEQWLEAWWQWTIAFPEDKPDLKHPRENYTADKCSWKQNGPVWFLQEQFGPPETRSCEMPRDKAVFAMIYTFLCYNNYIDELTDTDVEINKCVTSCFPGTVISATLDGQMIQNPEQYGTQTRFYWITVPNDNIFDAKPGGVFRGKANAFFVLLEPLSAGKHELHLTASAYHGPDSPCNFSSDVTYHIMVK